MFNNIKNKLTVELGALMGTALGLLAVSSAHAQLSTTTLGTSIDSINATWYDLFLVLLQKYWVFVVGAGILVAVWHYGRRLITAFN